jgi:restriction endonuclease Mrr
MCDRKYCKDRPWRESLAGAESLTVSVPRSQHNPTQHSTTTQQHNNTTAQQHNSTTAQQHNNTTAQQHNNTTTQQHNELQAASCKQATLRYATLRNELSTSYLQAIYKLSTSYLQAIYKLSTSYLQANELFLARTVDDSFLELRA